MKAKRKSKRCQIPDYIRVEGHNLRVAHTKKAGRILATDGKQHKRKRMEAGCFEGLAGIKGAIKLRTTRTRNGIKTTWAVPKSELGRLARAGAKSSASRRGAAPRSSKGTFRLSAKQKRNLPPQLQRAIIESHRRRGERIIY